MFQSSILSLYDNTEPKEFQTSSSESAFENFAKRRTIRGVSGVDATSFLRLVKSTVVGKLQEKDNTTLFFEFEPIMYTKKSEDEDIRRIFFQTFESEIRKVCDLIKYEKEMILTDDDKRKYKESIHCHICGKSEFTEEDWEVRDHCHISGKFKGAAYNCNTRF